jgi:hypothetical protein
MKTITEDREGRMNVCGEVIEAVALPVRLAERDGKAPVTPARRGRERVLRAALIMGPVVALLGAGVALVGLSAVTTGRSYAPAARILVDAEEAPLVYEISEPREVQLTLGSVYTR